MSTQEKADKAQKIYQDILDLSVIRDQLVWEEARLLTELRDSGLFKYVFGYDEDGTWTGFIKQSELPVSTVNMKNRLYDFYVKQLGVPTTALSKIHTRKLERAITPLKEKKTTIADVLDIAPKIPFLDFKKWVDDLLK